MRTHIMCLGCMLVCFALCVFEWVFLFWWGLVKCEVAKRSAIWHEYLVTLHDVFARIYVGVVLIVAV